jgi:hypothetical protein
MSDKPLLPNEVDSSPTKEFFVDMLTRDIELSDAILDLLDNCLDGVVRQMNEADYKANQNYYEGYKAKIEIKPTSFCISDNCGGISKEIARKYAFRMGRSPEDLTDEGKPTVGVYGIGMKRAIFKMGLSASVVTKNANETFCVDIPVDWVKNDDWKFTLKDVSEVPDSLVDGGTIIKITHLTSTCKAQWRDSKAIEQYINRLVSNIRQSYSFIIEKGFEITVNDIIIKANPIQIKFEDNKEKKGIKPYIYFDEIDGVKVSLTVGMYTSLLSADEIEEHDEGKRSSDDAGWTIICNDRVILYNDKSHVTGWGEAGVPKYHTQFISIKGLVFFECSDPEKLPTTTTKRGINLNSEIYAKVKERMREGLKTFTSYTNKWKGRIDEEKQYSSRVEAVTVSDFLNQNLIKDTYGMELKKPRGESNASYFMPELPMPKTEQSYLQIRYSKPKADIEYLCQQLFDSNLANTKPSMVGEECFDRMLSRLKSSR